VLASARREAAEEVLISRSARLWTEGLDNSFELNTEDSDDDDEANASDKTGTIAEALVIVVGE
jgi:hypothetical protein